MNVNFAVKSYNSYAAQLYLPISSVYKFIDVMGSGKKLDMQEIALSRDNIIQYAGVIVLHYE